MHNTTYLIYITFLPLILIIPSSVILLLLFFLPANLKQKRKSDCDNLWGWVGLNPLPCPLDGNK